MHEADAQLYIGGHTHAQVYMSADHPSAMGINTLLTGAGGGIQNEEPGDPTVTYGFSTLRFSRDTLRVRIISDNGTLERDAVIQHY